MVIDVKKKWRRLYSNIYRQIDIHFILARFRFYQKFLMFIVNWLYICNGVAPCDLKVFFSEYTPCICQNVNSFWYICKKLPLNSQHFFLLPDCPFGESQTEVSQYWCRYKHIRFSVNKFYTFEDRIVILCAVLRFCGDLGCRWCRVS